MIILKYIALGLIRTYQWVTVAFGKRPSCTFYPTCSEYARICFEKYSPGRALWKTFRRVIRCHPWHQPEIDQP